MKILLLLAAVILTFIMGCHRPQTLFEQVSSDHSGIDFNNQITENDSINPLDVVNVYNGGGVGIGDFNNDGLQDIYFTGNMVSSKLYLNKGNFSFEDITAQAAAEGMGRWARGVAVVDINNDGLLDLYVCNTIYQDSAQRQNILYINQGMDNANRPHFKDMAVEYGLDIRVQSTMANFFDYDNDGDLDMYLVVNEASNGENPSVFLKRNKKLAPSIGRLFRNDMDSSLNHPVFTDVSGEAGMTYAGFGHAATICDINNDGWKDIYVSNDFISDNILYINNHDGTFTNRLKEYFKHTSFNAMGQDVVDINNDGLADVVELDMNPEDNYRKKMMLSRNNYNTFQNFIRYGYQYQYVRNTLQLNQGSAPLENDSAGAPVFSEIGFLSGIAQTDWSWAPLVNDFDNDGLKDIIVTNGFPKDVSDHDFMAYRAKASMTEPKSAILSKIPVINVPNYAFKNITGIRFSDVSKNWGLATPTFSNGAAYADLDNDGDLDIVINNINQKAILYRNNGRGNNNQADSGYHYLSISLQGKQNNRNAVGAFVHIYYNGGLYQVFDCNPYRGYLSSNQLPIHFGLGNTTMLDSLIVVWPDHKKQVLTTIKTNQHLTITYQPGLPEFDWTPVRQRDQQPLFREVTKARGIDFFHRAFDFVDFDIQTTLPHKFSEYCPALAAGDIDGNQLDDLIVGGSTNNPAKVFLQQPDGKFMQRDLLNNTPTEKNPDTQDEGLLLLDVDGDNDLDLYIASGGYKYKAGSPNYQDRLLINNGNGDFTVAADALPNNFTSKLCVRAFDYNKDGKPDLFVSGRVLPWQYPKPVSSFIFRNDSKPGKPKFTDVTEEVAPELVDIGLVCDAIFSDFDNDQQTDLILVGEWMPPTFFKNLGGQFKNTTALSGLQNQVGWWNSVVAGDFRRTGQTDYIVGNTGLNTFYKASPQYPVYVTAKDFDHTTGYVPVLSLFLPDKNESRQMKEYPAQGREDIVERIPSLKKRYSTFKPFAEATMDEIFPPETRKGAQRLQATNLASAYLRNEGHGQFTLIPLPVEAQFSAVNGMIADDFDGDGILDVLINGNDYGTEVSTGKFDAFNGILLKGDEKGSFSIVPLKQSGFFIPGNGKALVRLTDFNNQYLVAASQHMDRLKLFALQADQKNIRVEADDLFAVVQYKDGPIEKKEFYNGSGFLSQSARFCSVNATAEKITITNTKGESRTLHLR